MSTDAYRDYLWDFRRGPLILRRMVLADEDGVWLVECVIHVGPFVLSVERERGRLKAGALHMGSFRSVKVRL